MSNIVILDEKTANQIAAGEVIERPASVVKEMAENAIDAGADQITIEIRNGGISYLRVTDNGSGMEADDVELAFERHATSKIRRIEDLDGLSTMGFRGEALASIASVSQLEVITKTEDSPAGTSLIMEGGRVVSVKQTGCPKGTTFIVKDLFYNTPARYKFLKKDSTEAGYVSDIIERLALAHPHISFKFIQNNQVRLHTPGNNDLLSVIYSIYGRDFAKAVLPVNYKSGVYSVSGFIGKPEIARGNRGRQSVFLNGRYIKNRVVSTAVEEAYKTMLMQKKFPVYVLLLNAPSESFDVNVHPQKLEVRFSDEKQVYSVIYHGVKSALTDASLIRGFEKTETSQPKYHETSVTTPFKKPLNIFFTGMNQTSLDESLTGDSEEKRVNIANEQAVTKEVPIHSSQQSEEYLDKNDKPVEFKTEDIVKDLSFNIAESQKKFEIKSNKGLFENNNSTGTQVELTGHQIQPVAGTRDTSLAQLKAAQIVGQAFYTYILLQYGETLYIIDQHAAHERIRYETLKKRLSTQESYSQGMLEPIIVNLSAREFDFAMEKQNTFKKLGFDIEAFGQNTVIVRSIPDLYDSSFSVSDFLDILDRWIKSNSEGTIISDEALYLMSCKGALKANRALSKEEITGLVESLCAMENPWTCVHGRPVIIKITQKELEKKFKRII